MKLEWLVNRRISKSTTAEAAKIRIRMVMTRIRMRVPIAASTLTSTIPMVPTTNTTFLCGNVKYADQSAIRLRPCHGRDRRERR